MKKFLVYIFTILFIMQAQLSNAGPIYEAFEAFSKREYAQALQKVEGEIETSPYAYALAKFIISKNKLSSDANKGGGRKKHSQATPSTSSSAASTSTSASIDLPDGQVLSDKVLESIKQKLSDISDILEGVDTSSIRKLETLMGFAEDYFSAKYSNNEKNKKKALKLLKTIINPDKTLDIRINESAFSFLMIRNFIPELFPEKPAPLWDTVKKADNSGQLACIFAERIWSAQERNTPFSALEYLNEGVLLGHNPLVSFKGEFFMPLANLNEVVSATIFFGTSVATEFLVFFRNQLKQKGIFEKIDLSNPCLEYFFSNIEESHEKFSIPEVFANKCKNDFRSNLINSVEKWVTVNYLKKSKRKKQIVDFYRDLDTMVLLSSMENEGIDDSTLNLGGVNQCIYRILSKLGRINVFIYNSLNNLASICDNQELKTSLLLIASRSGDAIIEKNFFKAIDANKSRETRKEFLREYVDTIEIYRPSAYWQLAYDLELDNKREALKYYKKGFHVFDALTKDEQKEFFLESVMSKLYSFEIYAEASDWQTLISPEIEGLRTVEEMEKNYEQLIEDLTESLNTPLTTNLEINGTSVKIMFFERTGFGYKAEAFHLKENLSKAFDQLKVLEESENREIKAVGQHHIITMQNSLAENSQGLTEEAVAETDEENYNLIGANEEAQKKMNKFLEYYIEHPEEIIAPTLNSWLGSFLTWRSNKDHKMAQGEIKELRSHGVKLLEASLNPSEVFLSLAESPKKFCSLPPEVRLMTRINLIKAYMQFEEFEKAMDTINKLDADIMYLNGELEYLNEEIECLFLKNKVSKKIQRSISLDLELRDSCHKIKAISQEKEKIPRAKSLIKLGVLLAQHKKYDEAKYIFDLISPDQDIKYLYLLMVKKAQKDLESTEAVCYLEKAKESHLPQLRFLCALYNISSNIDVIKTLLATEKETIEKYGHIWKLHVAPDNPAMPKELKDMLYPEEGSSTDSSDLLGTDSTDDLNEGSLIEGSLIESSPVEDSLIEDSLDEEDSVDESDEEQSSEIDAVQGSISTGSELLNAQASTSKGREGNLTKRDFSRIVADLLRSGNRIRKTKSGGQIFLNNGKTFSFHKAHGKDRLGPTASKLLRFYAP